VNGKKGYAQLLSAKNHEEVWLWTLFPPEMVPFLGALRKSFNASGIKSIWMRLPSGLIKLSRAEEVCNFSTEDSRPNTESAFRFLHTRASSAVHFFRRIDIWAEVFRDWW